MYGRIEEKILLYSRENIALVCRIHYHLQFIVRLETRRVPSESKRSVDYDPLGNWGYDICPDDFPLVVAQNPQALYATRVEEKTIYVTAMDFLSIAIDTTSHWCDTGSLY